MRIGRPRWWHAILLAPLAVAGIALIASWAILRLYGPAFTRERVEALLSESLAQPARVGGVHLSPWRGRVSLTDIEVPAGAGPGGIRLRAPVVDISVHIASLWRRRLILNLHAVGVQLEMNGAPPGAGGPDLFPLPEYVEAGPLRVGIGTVRISDTRVVFRQPEIAIEVSGADVTGRPVAGELDVSGTLGALRVDARGRGDQVERVALDGRLSADRVRIRRLGWRWHDEAMQLDGEIRHPWVGARELALHLKGGLPLAALAQAVGFDQALSGQARVDAEVTGPLHSPRIAGRALAPELTLAGAELREVLIEGRWVDPALRVDQIRARLGAGRLTGRLEATMLPAGDANLSLELSEVVLPGALAGLGAGKAVAEARARDGGVDVTRAEANWRGLAASLDGRIARGRALAVRGRLDADLRELERALGLGLSRGRASVSVALTGQERSQALDGHVAIADLVLGGHAVDPIEVSLRMASSAERPGHWEGSLESPRIRSDRASVEQIAATFALDGKRIELIRASARAAGAPAEATGAWEWSGTGRAHADLGPIALGSIAGTSALGLAGTGRAVVDAALEHGVTTARALVELSRVSISGVALGDGTGQLGLRGQAIEADLAFPSRRLRAEAAGRVAAGHSVTIRLALDALALSPLIQELGWGGTVDIDGRVSARGELSIPVVQPGSGRGVLRVTPEDLRLAGQPWMSAGPIVLRWDGPRVLVDRLQLDGAEGRVRATGALVAPDQQGLALVLERARLPGGLAALGPGAARAELRIADGVELTRLDARWPGLTASASGRARSDGAVALSARVEAELASLGPALGIGAAAGRVTLTADARGRGDGVEAVGSVRAPALALRGAALSDVELPFRLSKTALRIERARARIGASPISAEASAAWPRAGRSAADSFLRDTRVNAEIRAPGLRLQDVAPLLPASLRGRGELSFEARAEGTPRAWRGHASVASPLLELAAGPLRQLRASLALDDKRLQVTDLRVDALGAPARATATWNWAGGGAVSASLGPAPLARLSVVPAGVDLGGSGRATIDATMRSPADLAGSAHAVLDDVAVNGVPVGRAQLDATARDGVLRAEISCPSRGVRASGSARIDAGGLVVAEAALPGLDLATLTRGLLSAPMTVAGTLSARASTSFPLAAPASGEGSVSIDPIHLVLAGTAWDSGGPIEARWAPGGFALAPMRLATRDGGVIAASGAVGADGRVDGALSATVPLAMFAALRPEIREMGGVLELSLRATGTRAAPTLAGEGAIRGGNLLLRDRPETVRDVEARFIASSQGVQLRDATASMGGGRLDARGNIALSGWSLTGYRMGLRARNVALAPIEGFSSAWDADLELSGITGQARVEGRARLVRAMYNRDLSLLSLALSPTRAAAAADSGPAVRLRVRVDLDDNLVVRSRTADLRAGGVVSVEGVVARPVLFGSIQSREGRIVFRDRDWTVTSAAVRFADPRRLDPFIDVLATSHIGEFNVTMQITGPASDVTVRLSSTPRLSQSDLLSLVAFGVTGADLRESPATVVLGEVGKLLARDILGVQPTVTGLRVSAGSSAERASGSESHGLPGEDRSAIGPARNTPGGRKEKVRIEYQLLAPLFLSAEYDREGDYGADVVLRFRFR